jgi:hypothetical protein
VFAAFNASKFFFFQSWQGKGPFFLAVRVSGCDVLAFRFVPPSLSQWGVRGAPRSNPPKPPMTFNALSPSIAFCAM